MNSFTEIRPLRDQAELDELINVAAEDGHRVFLPTHTFQRSEARGQKPEIIGYASLCAMVPLLAGATPAAVQVNVWFSTKRFKARDTFHVINCLEQIAGCSSPARTLIVPCCQESPLYPFMPRIGYGPIMETVLWGKALNQRSEDRSQTSEARDQKPEVRSQRSEDRSQRSME